jgi:hypothetical protein
MGCKSKVYRIFSLTTILLEKYFLKDEKYCNLPNRLLHYSTLGNNFEFKN